MRDSSATVKTIALVAGEVSGDYLGAGLMEALIRRRNDLKFVGIGGPRMEALGLDSWYPMERLAVRGYAEVLRHYPALTAMRRSLFRRLTDLQPALFIGIDAPDFNLELERWLKQGGVRTMHYVSPSVWAWRGGRVKRIARSVDQLLVLFPFESKIYESVGVTATYVGHPLADGIPVTDQTRPAREQLQLPPTATVVAVLPGSRQSELKYLAGPFIEACKLIHQLRPQCRFLVPMSTRETKSLFEAELYARAAQDLPIRILFGHSRTALAAANSVLVASGTASLEAALFGKPMVIAYRMAESTWRLMSRMRYQDWVGLPNIIAGRFLVPEMLQSEVTPENLAQAVLNQLSDATVGSRLKEEFASIHRVLRCDASTRAAEAVLRWVG